MDRFMASAVLGAVLVITLQFVVRMNDPTFLLGGDAAGQRLSSISLIISGKE